MVWTHVHRRPDSIHVQRQLAQICLALALKKGSCFECEEELHQQKGTFSQRALGGSWTKSHAVKQLPAEQHVMLREIANKCNQNR